MAADMISDAPESADRYELSVEDGDVILLATDGVFDNISDSLLVAEIGALQKAGSSAPDPAKIQVILDTSIQTRPWKDIISYPYIPKSPKKDIVYHFLKKDILGL
jgi:hypothetical protein